VRERQREGLTLTDGVAQTVSGRILAMGRK
jgi:hypothetical protein